MVGGGYRLGGSVIYAGLTAHALGERVAVVTRAGPDVPVKDTLPNLQVHLLPSTVTTTFRNEEHPGGRRRQLMAALAEPIRTEDIPRGWIQAEVVMLAPVAGELGAELVDFFPSSTLVATPQGWLRGWNKQGLVSPKLWQDAERVLPKVRIAILSEWDLGQDHAIIEHYARLVPILVTTAGPRDATVYIYGTAHRVPAFPTAVVDATGAGDVFAAAFTVWFHRCGDPLEAARFAHCAASLSIEGSGTTTIPTLPRVEKRLERWKELFGSS